MPLKVAYKKLRTRKYIQPISRIFAYHLLINVVVDLGCVFVGHGLPKDFRTISKFAWRSRVAHLTNRLAHLDIFVPPAQVIDTVAIFYDPSRHRRLSLRFLSWFLLKQDIQTAEHDSIEDARCALQLYKKDQTFVQENRFEDVLEDIYEAGQRLVSANMARNIFVALTSVDRYNPGLQTSSNERSGTCRQLANLTGATDARETVYSKEPARSSGRVRAEYCRVSYAASTLWRQRLR